VISSYILRKYAEPKEDEKEDEKKTRVFFSDLLNKHLSPSCVNPRGILLYPGRWLGFSVPEAERLAQDILTSSKNQVYLLRVAHPYTNTQNAAELNPHITSSASDKHIDERFLFEGPVGLGEVNLAGDVRFGLSHNFRRFFVVREKLYGSKPSFTPFFFPVRPRPFVFYKPVYFNDNDSDITEEYVLSVSPKSRFTNNLTPTPSILFKANILEKHVLDTDRIWGNFSISRLSSPT
jgi:hypothetical protein